jgi:hypothetical protein
MAYGMTKVAAPTAAATKTPQHEEVQSSSSSPSSSSSFYSPRRLKLTIQCGRHFFFFLFLLT